MGGFTSRLAGDPRVRPVRIDSVQDDTRPARKSQGLQALATSIEQHGLLVPPVVTVKDRQVLLLGGARRLAAAAMLGRETVDAFWVGGPVEMSEWLDADLEAQGAHDSAEALPMTWTQLGFWYRRILDTLPRGNFIDALCRNTRQHRGDIQGADYLIRTMREHEDERVRRYARAMLRESEEGVRKPHAAVRYVREFEAAPGGPESKVSAAEQAKIIANLAGQAAGIQTALELLLPVHPDLSADARKQGGESLANLGRVVSRVGRVLREKEEGTS